MGERHYSLKNWQRFRETRTRLINGFGKGTASQAAEELTFRIRVSLQRYRKSFEIKRPFRG